MSTRGMRFDPELTRKVRDFILARGASANERHAPELEGFDDAEAPERSALMRRVAPLSEALFLIMSADGVCQLDERVALRGAMRTLTDDELDDAGFDQLLDRFAQSLADEGLEARIGSVAAQLSVAPADAAVALELAAAVIIADGNIDPRERAAFEQLAEQAGADPDQAMMLLD